MRKLVALEARFAQFKDSISPLDWKSAEILRDEAIEREETDLELAYLIMKRANILKPKGILIMSSCFREKSMDFSKNNNP